MIGTTQQFPSTRHQQTVWVAKTENICCRQQSAPFFSPSFLFLLYERLRNPLLYENDTYISYISGTSFLLFEECKVIRKKIQEIGTCWTQYLCVLLLQEISSFATSHCQSKLLSYVSPTDFLLSTPETTGIYDDNNSLNGVLDISIPVKLKYT